MGGLIAEDVFIVGRHKAVEGRAGSRSICPEVLYIYPFAHDQFGKHYFIRY